MEERPQTPGGEPSGGGAPQPPQPPQTPVAAGAGAADGPSRTDAMGLDKYRKVIGKTYGPTRRRQLTVFGTFFACVAVLLVGGKLAADQLDKPPKSNPAKAPWSVSDAPQRAVTIPTEPTRRAFDPTP